MPREAIPINALLWRTFTPAILVVAIALGALVYNRLYDTILDGFSRKLVTTSALTGALIDPADHETLMAAAKPGADPGALEQTPAYLRNVLPMRRIKRELGLTYLYSQVVGGSKDIWYVLDASEGDDHSAIGAEDHMTPATLAGLKAATARGTVYVSPIEFQEQWGLLKTAAAPIRGPDGAITATAGADVDIGVIQVATQNALFASALIGAASLLACALVTLLIMRRVAQPITRLKADALRIAAGDRSPPTPTPAPREVRRLREALGTLAEQLIAAMRTARVAALSDDRTRNLQLLTDELADDTAAQPVALVDNDATLVVWVGDGGDDLDTRLTRRAQRLLADRIAAEPDLASDWQNLNDPGRGSVLVFDRTARSVRLSGDTGLALSLGGAATRIDPGEVLSLDAGTPFAVLRTGGAVPVAWEAQA